MSYSPLISVVIVSYNTVELTLAAIKKVLESEGFAKGELEVIVVDNNSTDDTVSAIKSSFKDVVLLKNTENLGFGKANNQGIKRARGIFTLLLNTDAFLAKQTLHSLYTTLEVKKDLTSVAPALLYKNGSLQQSAGYFPSLKRVMGWMWWWDKLPLIKLFFSKPYHISDLTSYRHDFYPDWLMGACILFRTSDLLRVGGFDENIFMYGEEVELYLRLSKTKKIKNLLMSSVFATHLGSASTKKTQASRLFLELHSIIYIYRTHFASYLALVKFFLYTGIVLRLVVFTLTFRTMHAKEYFKILRKI